MESLANNHAFVDGNKRISFALTDTFLRSNGCCLEVDAVAAHKFITQTVGRGEFRFRILREWIADHLSLLPRWGRHGPALLLFSQLSAQHALEDPAEFSQRKVGNRRDDPIALKHGDLLARPEVKTLHAIPLS